MNVLMITRRAALIAASAFAMAACSQAGGETVSATSGDAIEARFVEKGIEYGSADAPVTLVEYASLTCGHCKTFHETVMPTIKKDYVKTGKVKFVFREFPTPPVQIALAGFVTARCVGPNGHMGVLDDFFASQDEIFEATRAGQAEAALISLAGRHGLDETQFRDCLADLDIRRDIAASIEAGEAEGVNSTPTLILDGEKLGTVESRTVEGLSALIDAKLGVLEAGEPEPETKTETDLETTNAPAGEQ